MPIKAEIGQLVYRILGDNSGVKKSLNDTEKQAKKTGKSFKETAQKLKVVAIAAAVGLGLFFKKAFNDAKQAQEINQKFAVTFREVSKEAKAAANNLADNFGLAKDEAKELLSTTGDLLSGFGFTGAEALSLSDRVNTLAVDLASFSNIEGGATRASAALTSALLGEREGAKALGIVISEAAVKEELRRLGLEKSTGDALLRAKAEATYNIAVRQSTNAIGDFNRSQNSTANIERRLEAQTKNLRIEVGDELLPAFTDLGVMFLETSKDGGIIQKVLIKIAKAASFATRTVLGIAEGLNLITSLSDAGDIEKRQDALEKKQRKFISDLRRAGFTRADQLSNETRWGSILLDQQKEINDEKAKLNVLTGENVKQLKNTADRFDENFDQLINGNKKLDEEIDKREQIKKLTKDTAKGQVEVNDELTDAEKHLEKWVNIQTKFNFAADGALSILSSVVTLLDAQTEKRLNDLDLQEQRALEVAGVEEDTAVEKAEKELEAAKLAGDQELILEKGNLLKREKIIAQFDKKRAKAQHEGAMASWRIQVAMAGIQALQAPLNAYVSTLAIPLLGPALAPGAAIAAGIASGVLLAAVLASEPPAPQFAGGGIIPGSSSGTTIVAGENNQAEGIFNQAQMQRLLDIADGGGGGLQRVAPLSKDLLLDELFTASQNGELFISKKAVV